MIVLILLTFSPFLLNCGLSYLLLRKASASPTQGLLWLVIALEASFLLWIIAALFLYLLVLSPYLSAFWILPAAAIAARAVAASKLKRKLQVPNWRRSSLWTYVLVPLLLYSASGLLLMNEIATRDDGSSLKDRAQLGMAVVEQSLRLYSIHNSRLPTPEEGLQALLKQPDNAIRWRGPYIEKRHLIDPWGETLRYEQMEGDPQLRSAGPDKKWQTDDDLLRPLVPFTGK